jgi:hypothetical protein
MFGVIEINGQKYVERVQLFPFRVAVTVGLSILQNQRLVFPGVAPFLLKALTREVVDGAGAPAIRRFKFKFGNSDGQIYYSAAGTGQTNDRVIDTSIFGTGQFPYYFIPGIFYSMNGNFLYEVEDVSNTVPYSIDVTLHGSYLMPVQ